jgi:hypothetical protein
MENCPVPSTGVRDEGTHHFNWGDGSDGKTNDRRVGRCLMRTFSPHLHALSHRE